MNNEESARQLVAETEAEYLGKTNGVPLPASLVAQGESLIRKAKQLDWLEKLNQRLNRDHDLEMVGKLAAVVEEANKQEAAKKPRKSDKGMDAQTYRAPLGPALFMEGPKVRFPRYLEDKTMGVTKGQKIWVQPREYPERVSNRFLWLRGGLEGHGTTKPRRTAGAV